MAWIRCAVLCLALLGSLPSYSLPADSSAPTLTVLLFNYSQASLDTLTRTKEAIDNIFWNGRAEFVWPGRIVLQCLAPLVRRCAETNRLGVRYGFRIVDRQFRHYVSDNAFGFAIQPVWATVYYEPALRLTRSATDSESDISTILSYLIAHEIGHLLLGPHAHTVDGIMSAQWKIGQIQQALGRSLQFIPAHQR